MSDRIQVDGEALSALMDGELSEFELRRLLARVSEEPELLATWERYNLARAVFQPEPLGMQTSALSHGLSLTDRVMAVIEAEPAFDDIHKSPAKPVWVSQVAKVAVAASVALAVFVGMQGVLDSPEVPMIANQDDRSAAPAATNNGMQLAVDADAQQRLNEYIRSVSIPSRPESSGTPYNILLESPMLHPVSDRELVQEVERTAP